MARLESLPDELLNDIFMSLDRAERYNTALVSWHCYHRVVPHLYRTIELVDCRNEATGDEHDDTPMIRILLVLAKNPYLASKVQDLTHRCHISPPDAFLDLPCASFQDQTLSRDSRTLRLLSRAIYNLSNVQTLRIIHGHHSITSGLLGGFFTKARNSKHPIARLWLESCCLEGLAPGEGVNAMMGGLQSVRIRRLRAKSERLTFGETVDGVRGRRRTRGLFTSEGEDPLSLVSGRWIFGTAEHDYRMAASLDEAIYERLLGAVEFLAEFEDQVDHGVGNSTGQDRPCSIDEEPAWLVSWLATTSSSTLTSLNLDWVLDVMPLITNDWINSTTFPNLRAFQVRNAVIKETRFSPDTTMSLLGGDWLRFLEKHPHILCLAWPLEHFFHPTYPPDLTSRAEDVVTTLGRTLKELRVDADVLFHEEPDTDLATTENGIPTRAGVRRRFFIEHIAPYLCTLEVLKIEGCIPLDERSEIVRAVRFSPLRKLVVIGMLFSAVDTLSGLSPLPARTHSHLSQESPTVTDWAMAQTDALSPSSPFVPSYNPSRYSMLDTIALHHASTITTLKFCGFKAAPDIHDPTSSLFSAKLDPLRHLHNLQHLTLSFWMRTVFEGLDRDDQIRSYWVDAQSPTSTALAMPAGAYDENPWAKALVDDYAPAKLAENVATLLTPRLSRQALAQKGGVAVKALLLLNGHEIFDLEVRLDAHQEVVSYRGPTPEYDARKVREKMERRAWF